MGIVLVTGGARSGKSTFAEEKVKSYGEDILYIATSIAFDDGMKDRIKKHRMQRPEHWETLERYKEFNKIEIRNYDGIIVDCITLMVSNILLEYAGDFDKISVEEIDDIEKSIFIEIDYFLESLKGQNIVLVTNEVGMGLVPSYKLGGIFRDIAGRVNQYLAKKSEEVYVTISGIPLKIK